VPYDVKRLNSIRRGEADISDRDALIEVVAGMVETMVRAHRSVSAALEDRYRNQLRTLSEVTRRLGIEAELPDSLRAWASAQPSDSPASIIREAAERLFEPLLEPAVEDVVAEPGQSAEASDAQVSESGVQPDAVSGPPRRKPARCPSFNTSAVMFGERPRLSRATFTSISRRETS